MTENWIEQFKKKYNRAPRILHMGNIANNAYQISKILNNAGAESDVLCYDYYHCMGCPEWDDADYTGDIGDPFFPRWDKVNLHGFERPRWFAQGPLDICVEYLIARRLGKKAKANRLWRALKRSQKQLGATAVRQKHLPTFITQTIPAYFGMMRRALKLLFTEPKIFWVKLIKWLSTMRHIRVLREQWKHEWLQKPLEERYPEWAHLFEKLRADAKRYFPDREMEFGEDCLMYFSSLHTFEKLFQYYDIVQGYATCPIWPYLAGFENYIAFEHGTIGAMFIWGGEASRIDLLSYPAAKAIYVTNIDCYDRAKYMARHSDAKLICGLHGLDIDRMIQRAQASKHIDFDGRFGVPEDIPLFFTPARHDILPDGSFIKGETKFLDAAEQLLSEGFDFRIVILLYGQETQMLKDIIAKSPKLSEIIIWSNLLNRRQLYNVYMNADAILDQFEFPAYGSVTFETLAAGHAVLISSYANREYNMEFFGDQLPYYSCRTVEDIYHSMKAVIINRIEAMTLARQGPDWLQKRHSHNCILDACCKAYENSSF